jgi:hypothetical protein
MVRSKWMRATLELKEFAVNEVVEQVAKLL